MFGKIYPQSAAHITTIHGCFTILQFTDPRSLVLDPRSDFRFPIPDPAFPVKQLLKVFLGCSFVGSGRKNVMIMRELVCPDPLAGFEKMTGFQIFSCLKIKCFHS